MRCQRVLLGCDVMNDKCAESIWSKDGVKKKLLKSLTHHKRGRAGRR